MENSNLMLILIENLLIVDLILIIIVYQSVYSLSDLKE